MLSWVTQKHLEIKSTNQLEEMWQMGAQDFLEIDNKRTTIDKFDSIVQLQKFITDVLQINSIKDEPAGADDLLPIIIYILLKAQPQKIYSNINFLSLFTAGSKKYTQQGYCLQSLKSAMMFLEKIDHTQIKIDRDLFEYNIYKKEVEY